jgi:hypothetical protein
MVPKVSTVTGLKVQRNKAMEHNSSGPDPPDLGEPGGTAVSLSPWVQDARIDRDSSGGPGGNHPDEMAPDS